MEDGGGRREEGLAGFGLASVREELGTTTVFLPGCFHSPRRNLNSSANLPIGA